MDVKAVRALLKRQDGVVSRRQLTALGVKDQDIRRLVRRREWARMFSGVFVEHTGPPTWRQRAWAAVLMHEPAALAGSSALHAEGIRGQRTDGPIVVCIAAERYVRPVGGIRVERVKDFDARCRLNTSPPRMRLEYALLFEASRRERPDDALAVVADAVQQGKTTVGRLVGRLADLTRLRHRALLLEILGDVAVGAYSVLEQHYLADVERPHGLPTAQRQRRVRPGKTVAYRDVDYVEHATSVELDGRVGHEEAADRWQDLERDLEATVVGQVTMRVGWGQVLEPCRLALIVGGVLGARGWDGVVTPCGPGCTIAAEPAA
ncbi:type IV toxin-antitoxin system AbiEi family antitoxin domain-containing protein [Nocardioides dilutus]